MRYFTVFHFKFKRTVLFILILIIFGLCSLYLISSKSYEKHEILNSELPFTKQPNFFVVVIFSSPENYQRREVIRKTWLLTKKGLKIIHYFAIGTASLTSKEMNALQNEQSQCSDLLLLNSVSDSFSKLSNKLLEIFMWLKHHLSFTFLLKVDDDSFVRLDALYSKILEQPKKRLYWGFFDGQAHVKRKGKWQEKNWFLCDRYLPYAKGGGYILTSDLIDKIVQISEFLSLYQNEDVSLGTWLSPFDIKRLHDPQFDTEFLSRGCHNSYLITHKQTTDMMISKYNNILKSGNLCLSEYKSRNSFIYNWNVLPSLCCDRNDNKVP